MNYTVYCIAYGAAARDLPAIAMILVDLLSCVRLSVNYAGINPDSIITDRNEHNTEHISNLTRLHYPIFTFQK